MKHLLFSLLLIVCCNTVFGQTDEKGIVLGLERSAADAFSKHNVVFLTSAYADNAHVVNTNGEVITKPQLLQSVENLTSASLSEMDVRIESNVAIVTGINTITGKDDNGNYSHKMRFTDVLLKTKGKWQIIASQSTTIAQ